MNLLKTFSSMAVAISLISCGDTATSSSDSAAVIGKQEINISNRRITPEALWAFGRLNDMQVSPDGTKILYGVTYFCVPENKSNRDLFVINSDGTDNRQITATPIGEHAAKWVKGGEKIAFLSAESGEMQLWEMNVDGSNRVQISTREGGISDFLYSPDNSQVLFIADVKYGERTVDVYPDLDKASGIIVDDLMYKHWDEWVTAIPHPFLADSNGSELSNERDLLEDEPFECPMKPFGGIEQVTFSPDGKTIAYVCRRKVGLEYALSTNSDIYLYDIATGTTVKNLTDGMMGYDINPSFSPDGTLLAFQSMERDGCESDKNRLFVLNLVTGERTDLSAGWDQSTESFIWSKDGKQIYLISCQHAVTQIYRADVAAKTFSKITDGQHDYESVALTDKGLAGVRHSMSMPNEIYTIDEQSGLQTPLTFENKHILDQLEMGRVEERWIPTTDGKQMLVWVVYPPEFDPKKKYPTLLYCQGGPQSPVSQFWSYRWNLQIMAANDYIIVAPNRRGLYGFGQEWLEQISKDYGGQNMRDYLSAIDAVAKEPYVDSDHLGCVGASYGGFSVYWLAGHHNKRFKAFIAHDGMFNLEQQFLETEEMWFVNWDIGGAYWDKNNIAAQRTYASSPHRFVDKWDAPILVIHGEKDYRILASQGMAAFNAAKLRGVPAEMLIFPDENHWVLKPQNGILWQRTFFRWLDRWLKVNE